MPDSTTEKVPDHVRDVLSYFLRNPRAVDDLEGVTRWRIREEAIHRTTAEVDSALAWLVTRRFLVERALADSRRVFFLNPDFVEEATRFLHAARNAVSSEEA